MSRTKLFLSPDGKVTADQMVTLRKSEVDALIERANRAEAELRSAVGAVMGLVVLADLYFERQGRDPYNNDNYCRAMDWLKTARAAMGGGK